MGERRGERDRGRYGRLPASVTPAAGAEVMATGIVSVGLHLAGWEWPSRALLVVAVALWAPLGALFAARLSRDRRRWTGEADTPAALTAVAGTAVLGVRLSLLGWNTVALALLVAAAVLWLVLLPAVLRHLRARLPGAAYLVCVSTQSLAVLGATLAVTLPAAWPVPPAVCLLLLGLGLYAFVLAHFDFGQLRTGAGDHWVAGGAIAISALAAAKLAAATAPAGGLHALHGALRAAALVLVGIALAWYAVLVFCEVRWPRPRYDVRRWSTVFPLGMTAVAAMTAGAVAAVPALAAVGAALLWPAVAVWALVAAGTVRAAVRAVSGG
ncbi:tellurite resistance/C4-dicarboxylate transporter family protein [Spirillospora sp. CA-253888]